MNGQSWAVIQLFALEESIFLTLFAETVRGFSWLEPTLATE